MREAVPPSPYGDPEDFDPVAWFEGHRRFYDDWDDFVEWLSYEVDSVALLPRWSPVVAFAKGALAVLLAPWVLLMAFVAVRLVLDGISSGEPSLVGGAFSGVLTLLVTAAIGLVVWILVHSIREGWRHRYRDELVEAAQRRFEKARRTRSTDDTSGEG